MVPQVARWHSACEGARPGSLLGGPACALTSKPAHQLLLLKGLALQSPAMAGEFVTRVLQVTAPVS